MMRYKNEKDFEYHDRNEKNIIQSIIPNIVLDLKIYLFFDQHIYIILLFISQSPVKTMGFQIRNVPIEYEQVS